MNRIKLLNESENKPSQDSLKELKSLPYKDFVNKLMEISKSKEFVREVSNLEPKNVDQDYGVIKYRTIKAEFLVPTQSQIGLKESLSWLKKEDSIKEIIVDKKADLFKNNRILIANNKWILDGHHRWSYVYLLNPKAEIPCININVPGQTPMEILKDVQLSIAATYNELYVRPTQIETNISQLNDSKILDTVKTLIPSDKLEILRASYNETDFMKFILREFIIPESVYEANFNQNDFIESKPDEVKPIDPEMQKLDDEDNDNPDKEKLDADIESGAVDNLQTGMDFAGIIDPTGVVDVLNGLGYLYTGEYFLAICSFVSAIPFGDVVGKPLIAIAKAKIVRKLVQKFSKVLKSFDAKKAAEIWLELEKQSPKFKQFMDFFLTNVNKLISKMSDLMKVIGDHWLKFRIFYFLFKSKIVGFFEAMFSWRDRLKEYLNKTSEQQVWGIISSNTTKIKRLIVDMKVDKMNVNFAIGPHPIQTALKARTNPYTNEFKGLPKPLIDSLPRLLPGLQTIKSVQSEPEDLQVKDFKTFNKKSKGKRSEESKSDKVKNETPKQEISSKDFKSTETKLKEPTTKEKTEKS